MSVLGPQEFLLVTLPGTAKTSRFCSRAQRDVILVPLYSAASTTSTPIEMPLMMRLRMGKFCGAAKVFMGNSEIRAPPRASICSVIRRIFLGINNVHASAENGHRLPFRIDGAAVGCGVDAASQAAENDQSTVGQIAGQALCHPQSVGRGMASAHDRDSRLANRVHIAAYIKDERRIVNLLQLRRDRSESSRQTTETPAAATRPISSCASSID